MTRQRTVHCCMGGCATKRPSCTAGIQPIERTRLRLFPRDPKTCLAWVKASGNPKLINLPISKLSTNYHLCDKHFESSGERVLKPGTVPSKSCALPLSNNDLLVFLRINNLHESLLPDPTQTDLPMSCATAAVVSSQPKEPACQGLDELTVTNVREFLSEYPVVVDSPQHQPDLVMEVEQREDTQASSFINCCDNFQSLSGSSLTAEPRQSNYIYLEHNYARVGVDADVDTNMTSVHEFSGNNDDPFFSTAASIQDYFSSFSGDYVCEDTLPGPTDNQSFLPAESTECLGVTPSNPSPDIPNVTDTPSNPSPDIPNVTDHSTPVQPSEAPISPVKTPGRQKLVVVPNGTPSRPKQGFTLRPCPPGFSPMKTPARPKPGFRHLRTSPKSQFLISPNHSADSKTRTRSRKSLLSEFGIPKADVTPRKKALWSAYLDNSSKLKGKTRKCYLLRKRLDESNRELKVETIMSFLKDKLSPGTRILVENELRNHGKPSKQKRYSREMKCLALAMHKKGPKAYRLAKNVMGFPSTRSLSRFTNSVDFQPGISGAVLNQLKHIVAKMNPKDRVCSLLFDEMAIRTGVYFNEQADKVDGFVNVGNGHESSDQADHALVFMVQGLMKNWKQPVGFYVTKNTVKADDLVRLIREEVIPALQKIGLIVKCTICDRGTTNESAIKKLTKGAPHDEPYFIVNGQKIFTLFDAPHLLKCTRNHLFDKKFCLPDGSFADLDHISDVVHSVSSNSTFRPPTKLQAIHVDTKMDTRAKMRVKYAAQLFSKSVEAVLRLIDVERRAEGLQPAGHLDTAEFVGFMDKLFDSVNGFTMFPSPGKPLFSVLKSDSGHLEFWEEAIAYLDSLTVYSKKYQKDMGRATVQDAWIHTLKGIKCLWKDLNENYQFQYLILRRLNQDALENFFSNIRLSGQWNNNPTAVQFIAAIKTALVDLITNMKIRGTNCEMDDLTFLASLNALLDGDSQAAPDNNDSDFVDPVDYSQLSDPDEPSSVVREKPTLGERLSKHSVVYVSGFVARGLMRKSTCSACRQAIQTDRIDQSHLFIRLKEYNPDKPSLVLPSKELTNTVNHATLLFEKFIRPTIHLSKIRQRFFGILIREIDFSWLCRAHHQEKVKLFCKLFSRLLLHNECKRINKGGMWRHLSASNARMMSRFLQCRRIASSGTRSKQVRRQPRKTPAK